jgi:hypothetical protein
MVNSTSQVGYEDKLFDLFSMTFLSFITAILNISWYVPVAVWILGSILIYYVYGGKE